MRINTYSLIRSKHLECSHSNRKPIVNHPTILPVYIIFTNKNKCVDQRVVYDCFTSISHFELLNSIWRRDPSMGTLFIPSRKDQRQGFVATHLASLPPRDTRLGHPQMRKLVPTCSQNTNVNKWSTNVNHHLCAMVKRLYTYMRVIHLIMKILANRYYVNDSKSPIWAIH